jgi:heme-degrading monooxygenase HmoA
MADAVSYVSGNWLVTKGSEDEFVSRWTQFLQWTLDNVAGFQEATLLRDADDSRHFVSFARWDDGGSRDAWRSSDGFAEKFGACRELCDDFQGGPFTRVASV